MAKVLIIDDSPTETQLLSSIMEKHGFDVIAADNGEDGIKMAKREMPDVVLMDVVMPGMNGFQATRQLTKSPETKHIPVIIITTKDQETDRIWGMRQGAKDYLTKPVQESKLLATVRSVLEG
jgi:twitching motility two-component system response regulator PilH